MASQKMYRAPGLDLVHLADVLAQWLQSQGNETQVLSVPGGLTVQARNTQSTAAKWGGGVAGPGGI